MYNEYYIHYNVLMKTDSGDFVGAGFRATNLYLGKDEYEAHNSFQRKAIKELDDDLRRCTAFKWSLARPTGRTAKSLTGKPKPFVEMDASVRSYIKGQITRFIVRFSVCDSEPELDWHHRMYEGFIKDYGNEIKPQSIIYYMDNLYTERLERIRRGDVKPINYSISQPEEAALVLKKSGYKIEKTGNIYQVTEPYVYSDRWYMKDMDVVGKFDGQALMNYYNSKMPKYKPGLLNDV